MVSELVAGGSDLARNLRVAADIQTTLEEGGPDIFAIQVLQNVQRAFARPIVKREADTSAPPRSSIDRGSEDL
jgi:hypothetical protein